ncbi:hypothetical protein PHYBLDRAFT_143616 [Phycomyces blakesleeanus NRRL 1555(-)]|uniref:Uncharacterized protein n=1 Tax=Phycomyces blakesleeanus (strain ATCC 8743b / DSM 1359 / FGSC 10004 / NBRC 33097 / NRRL 1555) TaxID=763407 RepID=A0A167N8W6_PHYB8|nr:hypothetical protein PHYBLDRAFT_143616 [Phycomyces blakesleeanus NRRL 1555(-)]OAD75360.1 hypothetical protein PHYBLDRAFT_143616 [Phycomyces blakesleeanus NRRL 1555(-)]|eukprot:XP_018293400.1 hypothetical protein PHYBLDRAFT_143616 [Phycomyces blakesleeanus NRRL 1555(-)]
MVNFEISQPISVPEQTNVVSSIVSGYTSEENTATIDNQTVDAFNNGDNDNDQPMYDANLDYAMDDVHVETSPLIFDFSQPTPILNNDNTKNLEFIKIIKDFGISHEVHEMIACHFNKILETFNDITYRACSSYLGDKRFERFSSVKGDKYDICHNDCKLYNDSHETVCLNCGEAHYKNNAKDKDGLSIPVKTMIQIPLARQLALCLANDTTRNEMMYRHNHQSSQNGSKSDIFDGQAYELIKHLFSDENDITISLSVDCFAPHKVSGLVTILHATMLNLPPMIRYKCKQMIQITMIPATTVPANF